MRTWKTVDKSGWPSGEWNQEPDKAQWIAHGLDCLIVRGPSGALCGYVGVPPTHPFYEKDYYDVSVSSAHGGLTFADHCADVGDESSRICHVQADAANPIVWWLGFDCAHSGDRTPAYERVGMSDGTYKHFGYVQRCVEEMAAELVSLNDPDAAAEDAANAIV